MGWLADLYMHAEITFQTLEQGKMKSVSVTRTEYCLTDEAFKEFKNIHDECELDICEKSNLTLYLEVNIDYINSIHKLMLGVT